MQKTNEKVLFILLLFLPFSLFSQLAYIWDNDTGSNNFEDANNWSPNGNPGPSDHIQIQTPGTTVNVNTDKTVTGLMLSSGATLNIVSGKTLTVCNNGGVLDINDGTVTGDGRLTVANSVPTTFTISNCIININAFSISCLGAGSVFNVNSGTITTPLEICISDGDIAIAGGTFNNVISFTCAPNSLTISGGTFSPAQTFIADNVSFNSGTYDDDITLEVDNFSLNNSTFNGNVSVTKTGSSDDTWTGGNTFNGSFSLINTGTGDITMGNTTADDFNGSVTFEKSNTGDINVAYGANATFSGSITCNASSGQITFNASAGSTTLDGGSSQTISGSSTPLFKNLTINKSANHVTLNTPVEVSGTLTLTQGKIISGATNKLTMLDNSSTSIGDNDSYVDGYLDYKMALNGSRTLNFPVGSGSDWRPFELTPTHSSATSYTYTAYLVNGNSEYLPYTKPSTITNLSRVHYYDISRSSSSTDLTSATVKFYYKNNYGTDDNVTDAANLGIVKTNGASTVWLDITSGGGTANGTGTITSGAFTSFSKFSLGNRAGGANPLPIELIDFKGSVSEKAIELTWTTASEKNNDYFTVEKSSNGTDFTPIAKIKGAGNSNEQLNYNIIDESLPINAEAGILYYRLKQTDFDGTSTFSDIINIMPESNMLNVVSVFPNPVNLFENVYIKVNTADGQNETLVVLMDVSGKEVYSKLIISETREEHVISANHDGKLNKGIYFITATSNNNIYHKKLVVR